MPLIRASSLEQIFASFDPAPLTRAEVDSDFYVSEVADARGSDRVDQLALKLNLAHQGGHFKGFVMGHPGVGISTELTRLESKISDRFRVLRLSANTDFDPLNFRPFDFLLRTGLALAERTALPPDQGGAGKRIPDDLGTKVLAWFAEEKATVKTGYDVAVSAKAGAGSTHDSWWGKLLGLHASITAEAKTASGRSTEVIEYRDKRLPELLSLTNEIMDACNSLLKASTGHQWLIIGDDFDKPGIDPDILREFFIDYGNLIRDLRAHLILDLPVSLGNSSISRRLPANFGRPHIFPDTPVFTRSHTPHETGRHALRRIIETRAEDNMFAPGQADRIIVASGGNLRDLFGIITEAATNAILRRSDPRQIISRDVDPAIALYRKVCRDQLGDHAHDVEKASLDQKLTKLKAIYCGVPGSDVADATLYSLLHARAVQEFNGTYWYGVHPLAVDFLNDFRGDDSLDKWRDPDTGRLPGGTL